MPHEPTLAPSEGFSFALEPVDGVLQLFARHRPEYGGVAADWGSREMQSRIAAGKKQILARACGLQKLKSPTLLDGTAGLGRDAYTLARLGAQVTLCERQPLIAALLRDALLRSDAALELLEVPTLEVLASGRQWDVVYLDPMYPHTDKTALPGKEMQLFRDLTGGDADADALLAPALACAKHRVVVKRPRHAPPLAGRAPSFDLSSKLARFDVYLCAP